MKKQGWKLCLIVLAIVTMNPSLGFGQELNKPAPATMNASWRAQTIEALAKHLNELYVFPEVAKQMENDLRQRMKSGEYEQLNDPQKFAEKLTAVFASHQS